jgi:ABC-type transport system involved in multi-copper enzyme maturation permease subunit
MKGLLWKDYRLNRPLIMLCAAILGAIYLVGVGAQIASVWPSFPSANDWAGMFTSYGAVASYLTFCFTGLFGGHAIACERSDRSTYFLASLPPTKLQILASKLVVAVGATVGLWGWILLSLYVIAPKLSSEPVEVDGTVTAWGLATICVLTFGVGWFASACMEKTTIPIILALVSPVAVGIALLLVSVVLHIPKISVSAWSDPVCLGVGSVAFLAGTWNYCRRVEP